MTNQDSRNNFTSFSKKKEKKETISHNRHPYKSFVKRTDLSKRSIQIPKQVNEKAIEISHKKAGKFHSILTFFQRQTQSEL